MEHDEKLELVKSMQTYGGSFVVALSECILRADVENLKKLEKAFPEYIEKYKNMKVD